MIAVSAVIYTERTAVSIAAPSIIRDLRITETQMGSVFSAFYVAYTLSMLAAGALCDRFGPRTTLSFGILGSALFACFTGLGSLPAFAGLHWLLVSRLGAGAFAAPLFPACAKLTGNWFPAVMTARVQAILFGTTLLGVAVLPVAGTPVIARFGWGSVFAAGAILLVCVFFAWRRIVRDDPSRSTPVRKPPPRGPMSRSVWLLTVSYGAFCYFVYLLESWAFYYFREVRHFGTVESSAFVSAMMITAAFAGPAGGWLSDRLSIRYGRQTGRRIAPAVGILLSVALCTAGASGYPPAVTAVTLSISYGLLVACDAIFWAVTIEATGERAGTACGLLNTGGNCGGILAPVITPMIAGRFGWSAALWFGGAVALLALAPWMSRGTIAESEGANSLAAGD